MASVTHIHNGDVMAVHARRAGIEGEHFAFRESLLGGPVREDDGWIERRAKFLSSYGDDILRVSNRLFEQQQMISSAAASAEEIVLWFEYDVYCLIHLVYLLPRLPAGRTSVVWHDQPLGEIAAPEELLRLHARRRPATREMVTLAREAWQAYTAEDPAALNKMISANFNEFPFLRDGLALHAARFPSVRNGLGIIEQRILEFVADGATDFAALFNRFWSSYPRFGLGDTEVLRHLHTLAGRRHPLINLTEGSEKQASFTITEQGERTLTGADDVAANGIDLWLGGVHLTEDHFWRWDSDRGEIIPSRPPGS